MKKTATTLALALALLILDSTVYDIIEDYFDTNCYNYAGILTDQEECE